jgi:LPS-assembly protein
MKKIFNLILTILILSITANVFALEFIKKNFSFKKKSRIKISADVLSFDKKNQIFYGEGFVKIIQEDLSVDADQVKYNLQKKTIQAQGHVKIIQNGDTINCNKVLLDLRNNTGQIEKGEIFIKKRHFRIIGDTIKKDKNGNYILENVTLTSCCQQKPFWAFTAKNIKINPEGLGKAKSVKFRFGFFPYALLYVPYATFPTKNERGSGFLIPYFGLNGKFGARYRQGYYWAINQSSDMTFYYDLMSERGIKVGTEYRYLATEKGKGLAKIYFLDDSGLKRKDYSIYDDTKQRFYIKLNHYQEFDNNFKIFADINYINDINYKNDFPEDFKNTNFLNKQSIQSENSMNSIFYATKKFDYLNLILDGEYFQDLTKTTNKYTSQKLPEAGIFVSQNDFLKINLYSLLDAQYLNIYRKKGESFSRIYIKPDFIKPLNIKNYFITSTEISPTFAEYFFDLDENSLGNTNKFYFHLTHDGRLQLSKVYDFPYFGIVKFKHIIEPMYGIDYISDTKSIFEKYRHFDYIDNEINKNILKYGFKQRLIARLEDGTFQEFAYWELYQGYQIDKQDYFFNGKNNSDVYSDIRFYFWKNFSLENDLAYNPYENQLRKFSLWSKINFSNYDFLYLEYRYLRKDVEQYNIGFNIHFLDKFDFYNHTNYDALETRLEQITYGIKYSIPCFAANFNITEEHDPYNFSFNFQLTFQGLGSIGNF